MWEEKVTICYFLTISLLFDLIIMQIMFHCKEEVLEYTNNLKNCKVIDINDPNTGEVDIILEIDPKINQELDFAEFTEHFGINYDDVNCIEAHDFCAV